MPCLIVYSMVYSLHYEGIVIWDQHTVTTLECQWCLIMGWTCRCFHWNCIEIWLWLPCVKSKTTCWMTRDYGRFIVSIGSGWCWYINITLDSWTSIIVSCCLVLIWFVSDGTWNLRGEVCHVQKCWKSLRMLNVLKIVNKLSRK